MSLNSELPVSAGISKTLAIKIASGVFLTGVGINYAYRKIKDLQGIKTFDKIQKQKQQIRESKFIEYRQKYTMSPELKNILAFSLPGLKDELFKGELSSEDVLKAYIAKALEIQSELNCVAEFIPNAMDKAKALDNMHMVKGPLHGIPFCLIDDNNVTDTNDQETDLALWNSSTNIHKYTHESAYIVQCLESLGAIPFCRTNVPRTCLTKEPSSNKKYPMYGEISNPLKKKLSPGGPCNASGIACLVAAGGAPFGIGTDTVGCLRIPAHFCGISTLKPTAKRLTQRGLLKCFQHLPPIPGILANRAADVALVVQALTDNNLQNFIDGKTVPMSWNAQVFESKQKLRIGFFPSLSQFPKLGDTESVIYRIKTYLESAGHLLIPFEMPELTIEQNGSVCQPEDLDLILALDPNSSKSYKRFGLFPSKSSTVFKLRDNLADEVLDQMKELELDLILCPVFPIAAMEVEDMTQIFNASIAHTLIWSIMNFPAGVVKVWTESGRNCECSKLSEAQLNFGYKLTKVLEKGVKESQGMPIGVQIVGKPFQEELVLRTMIELDEINNDL